jgi:hypothetical protein
LQEAGTVVTSRWGGCGCRFVVVRLLEHLAPRCELLAGDRGPLFRPLSDTPMQHVNRGIEVVQLHSCAETPSLVADSGALGAGPSPPLDHHGDADPQKAPGETPLQLFDPITRLLIPEVDR